MKHLLAIMVFISLALATQAAPVVKNLKLIDGKDTESLPASELFALIQGNPKEKLFAVTAMVIFNENVTDYYRWIYDAEKKVLALMRRSSMKASDEDYSWRLWHDVVPSDFRDRLPYGNSKIKTTPSPFGKAVRTFPLKYPDSPDVVKWP